jgi:spermidine/putrescine transport system ATP-binding protein
LTIARASAIVNRPQVLLLDEPLGALDLKLRRQMQIELKQIQTEVGITFVHVTHDQEEAMTMADTVAVMNAGRIEQMGPPSELYESPETTFVANFLGQSNLIAGRVVSESAGDVVVDCHSQKVTVRGSRCQSTSGDVLVGIRPEKIQLVDAGAEPLPGDNVLTGGRITDASFTGMSTQYLVRLPWGQDLAVFAQNLGIADRHGVGSAIQLRWDPGHTFGLVGDAHAGVEVDEAAVVVG